MATVMTTNHTAGLQYSSRDWLQGVPMSIERIRYLLARQAEKLPSWLSNGIDWEICREIVEEVRGGKTARQLALEIDKPPKFVRICEQTWESFYHSVPPGLGESIDKALQSSTVKIWEMESQRPPGTTFGTGKGYRPLHWED